MINAAHHVWLRVIFESMAMGQCWFHGCASILLRGITLATSGVGIAKIMLKKQIDQLQL
jgi:hypothetical protein